MKSTKKCLCIMLFLAFLVPVFLTENVKADDSGDAIISVPITVQEEYGMANEFFQILNQNRRAAGLSEYKLDMGLTEMAMTRSAQMCIYFSHASMISNPSEHDALGDLQQGTPIQNAIGVIEDIADGTADARSTYRVWYDSLTHRPALLSSDYNYCGIGVVTYHNNIKWCLIVSKSPCGNTINGVSGVKTTTRNISAKAKYFSMNIYRTIVANANSKNCGADGFMNDMFVFAEISGNGCGYYVTQPGVFTFKSNAPELFDVDGLGRIRPKKTGVGSVTVFYHGIELCTTPVKTTEKMQVQTESPGITELPKQTEGIKETEAPKQTEPAKESEAPSKTETIKQPETAKQTEAIKQPETAKQPEVIKQPGTVKQAVSKNQTTVKKTPAATSKNNTKPQQKKFTVKVSNVTYSGKSHKPSLKVYDGKTKISSKYYKVVKYQNNKNVGYGTVIVKGLGKYSRYTGTVKFKILPAKMKLSSVSYSKGRLSVKWKKTNGINGYQILYGTEKNFKHAKSKKVGANTKSVKIKTPSKKTYYVKIRSYKKVGKEVWYSGWSTVKKVRAK